MQRRIQQRGFQLARALLKPVWVAAFFAQAVCTHAQLPAFPGAEGAGAFAVGGRNSGNVYVVTNPVSYTHLTLPTIYSV